MSNRSEDPNLASEDSIPPSEITLDPRIVKLTTRSGVDVKRTLPHRRLRTIGAWCFVDYFGPTDQLNAMSVAAHPHTGLQTVSWLFSGEVEHRDSLGSVQVIVPGELNLMTSGKGIAHSELSINQNSQLHGVQLWTALPDQDRNCEPTFNHYSNLPNFEFQSISVRVFIGEMLGHGSLAKTYTPLVGAELHVPANTQVQFPIEPDFEYGVLAVEGDVSVNTNRVVSGQLHYIPQGGQQISLSSSNEAKLMLLGGQPFTEKIVMWWNFIGRSHDEIVKMREEWQSHSPQFPDFDDQIGGRIPAPTLPNLRLSPRGNLR